MRIRFPERTIQHRVLLETKKRFFFFDRNSFLDTKSVKKGRKVFMHYLFGA